MNGLSLDWGLLDIEDFYDGREAEQRLAEEEPEEEYDCPIHGKLGGIDECPRC
jgi:hypothetical protein